MRRVSWGEHPQGDDNGEQAHDMDDQDQAFDHRQFLGQEGVEENGESGDGNDQHGSVPALEDVVWLIQDQKTLDDCPSKKSDRADSALPSRGTEPTCASLLVRLPRSSFMLICEEAIPVMKLRNFCPLFGANSDTQWYCPPDVGAIEAISAKLA